MSQHAIRAEDKDNVSSSQKYRLKVYIKDDRVVLSVGGEEYIFMSEYEAYELGTKLIDIHDKVDYNLYEDVLAAQKEN